MTAEAAVSTQYTRTLGTLLDGWPLMVTHTGVAINGLCLDSRKIQPGDLFVALAGSAVHGLVHVDQAIQRGCAAIVYDPAGDGKSQAARLEGNIPAIAIPSLGQHLGQLADRFYESPSHALSVIGVTGTNGKTSSSHFLAQSLNEFSPAGVIGTLGWGFPPHLNPTEHTTPDAIEIQRMLAAMRDGGCRTVAIEASSHGLDQGRLSGVRFKCALYTNFTRDHLDYHGDMPAYLEAKLGLLDAPGLEFVAFNADDAIAEAVLARKNRDLPAIAFSMDSISTMCGGVPLLSSSEVIQSNEGLTFKTYFQNETALVKVPVFGDFNHQNVLATLAVLLGLGYSLADATAALTRIRPVAGRMERYFGVGRNVVVDYAHTPDALRSVLESLRPQCEGKLWLVFGCGGDRDKGKRPEMGAVASSLADQLVITDDNPRTENGDTIIQDIVAGCQGTNLAIIRDRRAAITFALENMGAGDWLVIAGKGHEDTQDIQDIKIPFSDRAIVRDWFSDADLK